MASELTLLNQKQIGSLMRRCIRLAQKAPVDFFYIKKLKGCQGLWYPERTENDPMDSGRFHDKKHIILDPRRGFIGTLIHELIHELEPDWTERQVLYADSRCVNCASLHLILKLLKVVVDKVYKREAQKIKKKFPKRNTEIKASN